MRIVSRLFALLFVLAAAHTAFGQSDVNYCGNKLTAVSARSKPETSDISGPSVVFYVTFKNDDDIDYGVNAVVSGAKYLGENYDAAKMPGKLVLTKGTQQEFPVLRVYVHNKAPNLGPDAVMRKLILSCTAS
jgi:hypothetical protein